jgi:hypothetical protein
MMSMGKSGAARRQTWTSHTAKNLKLLFDQGFFSDRKIDMSVVSQERCFEAVTHQELAISISLRHLDVLNQLLRDIIMLKYDFRVLEAVDIMQGKPGG